MDFTSLFNMQGMMFCVLALGWYLRKSGMIDKSGKALLSSLVDERDASREHREIVPDGVQHGYL